MYYRLGRTSLLSLRPYRFAIRSRELRLAINKKGYPFYLLLGGELQSTKQGAQLLVRGAGAPVPARGCGGRSPPLKVVFEGAVEGIGVGFKF